MEVLIQLATGSQLIPDGESRILVMVHHLKISSLLLNYGKYNATTVHDIIRDVARSIAFTDSKYAFLQVTCDSWSMPSNADYRTRKLLRLDGETDNVHFYKDLVMPDLHTFWLQCNNHLQQFSGSFFSMFVNLSVHFSLEHFSLESLGNLEMLSLFKCDISKTDVKNFPKNLKTLCICHCDLPYPLDVANLKDLRKLEIQLETRLGMFPNVISSLSSLKELYIPNGITGRKLYYDKPDLIVMEISKLTHLTSLHFRFGNSEPFQGTDIFCDIDVYKICVGQREEYTLGDRPSRVPSTRSIELYGNHSECWEGLMMRAEEIILYHSNIKVSSICNGHRRAFADLKRLYITKCDNMGNLASISQDEIRYSPQLTCFSKLTILEISSCSKLKYLFCTNIAKSLVQLQELSVNYCHSMEAFVMNGSTSDGEIINFSKLKSLTISHNSRLTSFYGEKNNMHSCSRSSMDNSDSPSARVQPLFDGMVAFPSLEELHIDSLQYTSVIWGKDCQNDNVSSFCKLKKLQVYDCDELEIVIPVAMLHRLHNLEYLYTQDCSSLRNMFPLSVASDLMHLKEMCVKSCQDMTEIIGAGEQVITDGILFPELKVLELIDLQDLTSFWCYQSGEINTEKVEFRLGRLSSVILRNLPELKSFFHGASFEFHIPALKQVEVNNCKLSSLFTFSMFRKFQLENLLVGNCELLTNIVEDLRGDETCDKIITLFQLTSVIIGNLPNLKSFFHNANYMFHMPVLKTVVVRNCNCGFSTTLFKHSVSRDLKQLEELRVYDCALLEAIFEDVRGDETSDSSDNIITLSRLSKVYLEVLPKLKSLFYTANYECNMPALKKVKVFSCGLSILFTCSVFRKIQQLEKLRVSDCRLLERIVEDVRGDETFDTNGKIIPFYQLSSIFLEHLPNLKSFSCTTSYVFNMPNLHVFWLIKCPHIEYFTSLKTSTSLVSVVSDWHSGEEFPDLNDYIRQNRKRGIYSSDSAGESSYSNQELETEPDRVKEEMPQETETNQP